MSKYHHKIEYERIYIIVNQANEWRGRELLPEEGEQSTWIVLFLFQTHDNKVISLLYFYILGCFVKRSKDISTKFSVCIAPNNALLYIFFMNYYKTMQLMVPK